MSEQANNEPQVLTQELERQVADRTRELERANSALRSGMAERRRAEEQLKASLHELRQFQGALDAHAIVAITNLQGNITYANDKFCAVSKYSREELLGQNHRLVNSAHHPPEFFAEMWATITRGGIWKGEIRNKAKDGTFYWVDATIVPLLDEQGQTRQYIAIRSDITERKRVEETLQRLNLELERRVRERTSDLESSNRELQAAKMEADRANRAKNEFLSRMSHELRTPLNAVLGFAQLLEMDGLQEGQRAGVKQILRGGRHLLDLINEVLDLARIEAGRLSISPEPVQVGEVLQQAFELVRPMAEQARIQLELDLEGTGGWHVLADRLRLRQVLLNLLSNAIKYNHDGGRVLVQCEPVANQRLRWRVVDTGPGIPPAFLDRLFQPFERHADQAGIPGSGLGLALCKRLTELMGGTIGVETDLGKGSTFWIELPVSESPMERLESGTRLSQVPARTYAQPRVVLYVEDNLSNLELIESIVALRPAIRLLSAMQGQIALDLARQHVPDLIVLDVHLPDMDGEEVLRRLQTDPRTQGIPVLMSSADTAPHQSERLTALGVRSYVTKPIHVRAFLGLMDQLLS